MNVDLQNLLSKLNVSCKRALESASGVCVNRTHYEVDVLHFLVQLVDGSDNDVHFILKDHQIDPGLWKKTLELNLELLRNGNPGRPVFSARLIDCIEKAWMYSSIELAIDEIRSSAILAVICNRAMMYGVEELHEIENVSADKIKKEFWNIVQITKEGKLYAAGVDNDAKIITSSVRDTALAKFTTNFTQLARDGLIDPVFWRDQEIRQIIDVLARRRKNNPIIVGDAGVGKTAVVEGLSLKLAEGDVPDALKGVDIVGLDLGLLQAGASVKGEFENRLNSVIKEIKTSIKPIILFIDEAHTLIGAGGAAGTNDAANILKPALARGELRTIAATTWSEYKKYFEKDPALERRFQLIKLDEPTVEQSVAILRGLRRLYENSHGVYIRDEAITAAARLSARYITGRQLPDKAVDVLDTSCARVKISLSTKPPYVEDIERRISILARERDAINRDIDSGRAKNSERIDWLVSEIDKNQLMLKKATDDWLLTKAAVDKVMHLRNNHYDELKAHANSSELAEAIRELEKLQNSSRGIAYEVTADVVENVISDWTGIPINRFVTTEADSIFKLQNELKTLIRGQDHAIDLIVSSLRTAKAGLNNPDQPLGIFLLVGPSGVGKTETALGIANLMFGGERFMTTINMSEYQEKHTVSRLVGSSAGYVGYGEGGVLTEAIRQRPYSVLLIDEVEKADLEVISLFYQVFDKGTLADGEGRAIDFKNTVIFLTSNLAATTIMELCESGVTPDIAMITDAIRPELQQHFKPALLGRMTVIPYLPLKSDVLKDIIRHKLEKISSRLSDGQKLAMEYDNDVVEMIVRECTDISAGARNIDHVINKKLLPAISDQVLSQVCSNIVVKKLKINAADEAGYTVELY